MEANTDYAGPFTTSVSTRVMGEVSPYHETLGLPVCPGDEGVLAVRK